MLGVVVVVEFQSSLNSRLQSSGLNPQARSALIAHATRLADDPTPRGLTPSQTRFVRIAIDDSYVDGYRWAMWVCMILCLLSALVSGLLIKPEPGPAAMPVSAIAAGTE